jgi:hypothetical protein
VIAAAKVALDVGALMTKIAVSGNDGAVTLASLPTASGGMREFLANLLTDMLPANGGSPQMCVTVPDSWEDGDPGSAQAREEFRDIVEGQLGTGEVSLVGQLVAVAVAAAAARQQQVQDCVYLVCDVGGVGVRAALCEFKADEIRLIAAASSAGGGWREFSACSLAAASASNDPGLDGWFTEVVRQKSRLSLVLDRAISDLGFLEARACTMTGANGSYMLTVGQLMDCFGPTAQRLEASVSAVLRAGLQRPTAAVLTGALAWFPLASRIVLAAADLVPEILGLQAAVSGALLICQGAIRVAPPMLPQVSVPMHQVQDGLLAETKLILPWTSSFAATDDEPLFLNSQDIQLEIAGQHQTVHMAELRPGRYRIGIRVGGLGDAFLVLRADGQEARPVVHVSPVRLESHQ